MTVCICTIYKCICCSNHHNECIYLCGCHASSPIKYTKHGTESRYGAATTVTIPLPQWSYTLQHCIWCHDHQTRTNAQIVNAFTVVPISLRRHDASYAYIRGAFTFLPTHSIAPVILAHIFWLSCTQKHIHTGTLLTWHSAFREGAYSTRAVYIWVAFLVVAVIYALRVL